MRRLTRTITVLVVFALVGCGASNTASVDGKGSSDFTNDDAKEAYVAGLSVIVLTSMLSVMGQQIDGASMDATTGTLTLTDFDLHTLLATDAELPFAFKTISGVVTYEDNTMHAKLTFNGGPISSLDFDLGNDIDLNTVEKIDTTVVANGKSVPISITGDELRTP